MTLAIASAQGGGGQSSKGAPLVEDVASTRGCPCGLAGGKYCVAPFCVHNIVSTACSSELSDLDMDSSAASSTEDMVLGPVMAGIM